MNKKLFFSFTKIFFVCAFIYTNSYSQIKKEYNIFSLSDNNFINSSELRNYVSDAVILNINKSELENLCDNRNPEISLNIPYEPGRMARLNLTRVDIFAPNAKIVVRNSTGNEEVALDDKVVSYKGKVEGFENTLVILNFTRDNITGLMNSQDNNYILGSLKDNSGHRTGNYILYKESDLKIKNTFECGTSDQISPEDVEKMKRTIIQKMNDMSPTDLYIAEIALDIDYATYIGYGISIPNAANYALSLISAVSAVYMKEVNVKFIVTYLRVWTVPDPYTGASSFEVLNNFRAEWLANQSAVQRTLAHLISVRADNLGGIAWLNGLCANFNNGYAFSNTYGPIHPLPTYSWDVGVVSHELGHNFGSLHTHSCSWVGGAIDSCYATEGGCYSGPPIPRVGTIMSYCHLNGAISLREGFGPQPRAVLRNGAESAPCMYVSEREIAVGYPNGSESFRTGTSIQIYWGTSLTSASNVNVELSLNNGASWQTIQNNIPADQRILDWTIPYVSTTNQAKIRVLNSSNSNVGDTCDAPFRIILNLNAYNSLFPPSLTRIEVSPTSNEIQKFIWGSAGTNTSIRYKFKIRKLSTINDYSFTSDNNGADTTISLRKSFLDSLSQIFGTTGDSVRCNWRAWAYNGFDSLSTSNILLVTFTRTGVGINIISTEIPDKYSLENNYPNPFNPATNIRFNIPKLTFVELTVYDLRGGKINTLVNEKLNPGSYNYNFDAISLSSGVYFYRLKTSDFVETKRMILIK